MEEMTDNILQRVVEQLEEDNQCALPVQIHLFLKIRLLGHDAMSCEDFWTFKTITVQQMVMQTVWSFKMAETTCLMPQLSHPRRLASAAMVPWRPHTLHHIYSPPISCLHITFPWCTKQTYQVSWCSPVEAAWQEMWGHAPSVAWAEGGVMQYAIFLPNNRNVITNTTFRFKILHITNFFITGFERNTCNTFVYDT